MSLFLMQPNFLPWIGFFDMVLSSEKFVFLDDVQHSKGSWCNRNRIKTKNGLEWITIPIKKAKNENYINNLQISKNENLLNKIVNSISQNYSKSKYFHIYKKEFFMVLEKALDNGNVSEMNMDIITWVLQKLQINKKFYKSSDLEVGGNKVERIINICQKLNEKKYLTTPGAIDYLKEEIELFKENNIKILVHNYRHPIYKQSYDDFLSHASIIDLLFNEGHNSLDIIKSGRLEPLTLK